MARSAANPEKVQENAVEEQKIPAEVVKESVANPNEARLAEIQKQGEDLQKRYNEQHQYLVDTEATISDLEDRLTKQKEARNIFRANKTQIEAQYAQLVEEANKLTGRN